MDHLTNQRSSAETRTTNNLRTYLLLLIIWILILFTFSFQSRLPLDVTYPVKEVIRYDNELGFLSSQTAYLKQWVSLALESQPVQLLYLFYGLEYKGKWSALNLLYRKLGHFTVYGILALLIYFTIWRQTASPYLWTLLLSLSIALMDEWIQYYLPGRSSRIQDVLVDGLGAASVLLVIRLTSNGRFIQKKYSESGS
ncbi:VanZ family protein [Microaerobacter geothermalis]|uniref:VanZ family protein n=1 Tax=Microaerobacter geothermalis TaxID=674972 RepID=UPI001F436CC8|nr:VanZ family protein [Microaerobacter geothermalis]MCF6093435.1 VanZ family protein [Microaerobacter geothermalis]